MQSCYFEIGKLEQPDSSNTLPGYVFAGFVFIEAKTKDGKTVFFPWQRYKNADGKSYVIEVNDLEKAGCPYPPPCDDAGFRGCYD